MSYTRFYDLFPEVAMKETRSITVFENNIYNVPPGEYGLIDMYCDDEDCDCRRVFLMVISSVTEKDEATISFGWKSKQFYAKWFTRGKDIKILTLSSYEKEAVDSMHGIHLNAFSFQGRFAANILKMVTEEVLMDKAYTDRIKRHYEMFRAKIDERYKKKKRR